LSFENVRVPDSQRLGELGDGLKLMMTMINWRRLGRTGMDSGWMRTLVERAIRYLGVREVAGGLMGVHPRPPGAGRSADGVSVRRAPVEVLRHGVEDLRDLGARGVVGADVDPSDDPGRVDDEGCR
jgi:hypothetical protein